jgi:hypothetical protein
MNNWDYQSQQKRLNSWARNKQTDWRLGILATIDAAKADR